MSSHQTDLLTRYQKVRRYVEPGIWIIFWCVQALTLSRISWLDQLRQGKDLEWWKPAVWESSSCLVLLLLIPAVLSFERKLPLRWGLMRRNLRWHFIASLAFCLVHVSAMVAIRKLAYFSQHQTYDFGNWQHELAYEYLKDFQTYFAIIIGVSFYRLILLRWQGEASLLQEPDTGPSVEPLERPERFLVRSLGKEFLLPAAEIEWIQAWGNYVNLRVRGHDYPLRSTMAAIEQRIDPKRFVRVHRSYIANLNFITEIEPLDSGDARAKLRDGQQIPVSRRYRDELRKLAAL
ncbi:LytR/AlgR family response regulator transcription factor [Solimicrobium silvestre]|uniref:LytTr DNA-binding domain n=1 Tax=Solimicrobium silvestre TaxID=2099400 RepID=A0A2S9H4K9_9BURK|nr:LytTR family DNA-binding domain-containing protein [Solimicrobium silvestre]PRC94871.1 LytTr DNA-binding domain [Solimicrobium silvestre]